MTTTSDYLARLGELLALAQRHAEAVSRLWRNQDVQRRPRPYGPGAPLSEVRWAFVPPGSHGRLTSRAITGCAGRTRCTWGVGSGRANLRPMHGMRWTP